MHAAGDPFEVDVRIEHIGITAALRSCASFERRYPDLDARLAAYDDLEWRFAIDIDPRDLTDLRSLSRRTRALMLEVIERASGVCVRSWEEFDVLRIVFETIFEPVFVAPVVPELPQVDENARRDAIVVWAPHAPAGDCAIYAAALDDARMTVFIVGAHGDRVPGNAQFVPFEYAGDVLARAAVIVDASTMDPGWAIALAALGRPLAVAMTSGAHAYLDPVARFSPWKRGDIALAVARALGSMPPQLIAQRSDAAGPAQAFERIVVTPSTVTDALVDAVARRARGEAFELAIDMGHPFADAAGAIAGGLFDMHPDPAARAAAYDAWIASERNDRGDAAPSMTTIPPRVLETLRQCGTLADRMVYRSQAEAGRWNIFVGLFERPMIVERPHAAHVPPPQARTPDGRIVMWAKGVAPFSLGVERLALEAAGRPVTIVDDAYDEDAARDALVHASVVVAASHQEAGAALALAAWGIPLCACTSSGAGEWLRNVSLYLESDRAGMLAAILAAVDAAPPVERAVPLPVLAPVSPSPNATGPRVLCIVRARDGSANIERTRASLARQRYAEIETIELTGGGGRIARALNAAVRASDATYVAVIDAGDEWFPDHLASLVTALERSGRGVAYAETLIAHLGAGDAVDGYTFVARRPVEVASMIVHDAMLAAALRSVIRRDELIEAGLWNEHLPNTGDHELFLRLRKRADFVYVPHVTSRTRRPRAPLPGTGVLFAEHQLLHLLHPVPARPALVAKRAEALAYLKTAREFGITPPPIRLT